MQKSRSLEAIMPWTVFIVLIYFRAKCLSMLLAEEERNDGAEGAHPGGKGFGKTGKDGKKEWGTAKQTQEWNEWWIVLPYEYLLILSLHSGFKASYIYMD